MLTWGFASLKPALAKALTTAISFLIDRSDLPLMMVNGLATRAACISAFSADCRVASAMTACKAAGVSVTGGLTAWVSTLVVSVVVVSVERAMGHSPNVMMATPPIGGDGWPTIRSVRHSHSGATRHTPACYAGPPENLERSSRQGDWTAASRGAGARAREAIPRMYPRGQACGLIQSAGAMNGSDDADDRIARLLPEMVRYRR